MARKPRIWREWQHPRDHRGRFSRTGSEAWVKKAATQFLDHVKDKPHAPSRPGRPRLSAGAKAAAIFAAHLEVGKPKKPTPADEPGAVRRTVQEIAEERARLQVHYKGGWRNTLGSGSGGGKPAYVNLEGDAPGERFKLLDNGGKLVTRPYKQEFKEPLRPGHQMRQMAAWRADAAKAPQFRVKTKREEGIERIGQELADAQAKLADAQRRAKRRAKGKWPESFLAQTREDYVNRETGKEQHEVTMLEHQLNLFKTRKMSAEDDYLDKAGSGLAVHTGTVDKARPLAVYGNLMHIEDEDQATYRHLQDLSLAPAELHALVAAAFATDRERWATAKVRDSAGIFVGSKPIADMDHSQDLANEQPRGWAEGDTFGDVDGVYRGTGTLIVGVSKASQHRHEHGQPALHEFGHALDHAIGRAMASQANPYYVPSAGSGNWTSSDPKWRDLWERTVAAAPDMSPYFKQPGDAGPQEMWAEAFSTWARARVRAREHDMGDPRRAGRYALVREFRIPAEREDVAREMSAYFEDLVQRLGVDL